MASGIDLHAFAAAVRGVVDESDSATRWTHFANFPHGACGPLSELIGRYLVECLGVPAEYVSGRRDDAGTHAWVEAEGLIIDVTADQFGEAPVIVSASSAWHQGWHDQKRRTEFCLPEGWPFYPTMMWEALLRELPRRGFPPV